MRKVVIHRPGGYGELRIEEHPDSVPGDGEVLVQVTACGVNFADCIVRMGLYSSAQEYVGWPITPGFEVAGTLAGEGDVVAVTRFGGYASHLVVPRQLVRPRPPQLSPEQAAAFPTVHLTAYHALFHLAHARAGEWLLVHSAAGGVGGALVQLGRIAGCHVVGVVGAEHKVAVARELGAEAVIDRSTQDLWAEAERLRPAGFDVVLDASGPATLRQSYRHLSPAGRLVVYGFHTMFPRGGGHPGRLRLLWGWLRLPRFDPLRLTRDNRSVLGFNLSYLFDRVDLFESAMDRLLGWLADGKLQPPAVTTYSLDEVARAQADLEAGQTTGKLVLLP